jgi:hypothetical protein
MVLASALNYLLFGKGYGMKDILVFLPNCLLVGIASWYLISLVMRIDG